MNLMKYAFFFIVISIVYFSTTSGQHQPVSSIKLRTEASKAEKSQDFEKSIEMYATLYNRKPTNSRIGFKLADLLKQTRQYEKAMLLYKALYELDPNKNVLALYSFGQMAMAVGEYRLALRGFEKFDDEFVANEKKKYLKKLADVYIESIQSFIDTAEHPGGNDAVDAAFIFSANHFSEFRYDPFGHQNQSKIPVNDHQIENTFLKTPDIVPPGYLNTEKTHLYFSTCKQNGTSKSCAIFRVEMDSLSQKWKNIHEIVLPVKNKNYVFIHPTLGTDARRGEPILYFVSNMPGGKGGLDIWYSRFNPRNNNFREPKNAGSKINTAEDEFSPYYDNKSRLLYFSSKGLIGYGRFDVYQSTGEQRNWTEPENLGNKVNSSTDDYFYHFSPELNTFVFASNRDTWKHEAISTDKVYKHQPVFLQKLKINLAFNTGDDQENTTTFPSGFDSIHVKPNLVCSIELLLLENNKEEILLKTDSVQIQQEYTFDAERGKTYKINATQLNDTSTITFESASGMKDTLQQIAMDIPKLKQVELVKRVQYEVDQSKLSETDKIAIDSTVLKVLHTFPDHSVFIHSYTDQTGTDSHNYKLSMRRARNVYNYLISNNIDKSRMKYQGFGASNPLVPEKLPDGTDDPEGRLQNRRTEIIVQFIE